MWAAYSMASAGGGYHGEGENARGPAFFVQKRVGKGGKLFNCHKFRTMTVKHNGSTVSVAGDSRITPFGAITTKTKNILKNTIDYV